MRRQGSRIGRSSRRVLSSQSVACPTILEALADPALFGALPRFHDLSTWRAWIVLLKALFALPLDDAELQLFRQCTGRDEPPEGGADEVAAIVGRRGGKSFIAALIAVFLALFRDWQPYLATGERGHVVVIAQNMRAARVLFGYVRGILRAVPVLAREILAERTTEIDFRNDITVSIWPPTYKLRGLTIVVGILDEVDFWWQESINAAAEVIAALRPAMATMPGAKLIAISSPYTPTGWLYQFHKQHWAQPGLHLVWKAPSRMMNPTIAERVVTEAMAEDPERAGAEWEAVWRSGISALFEPALLDACVRSEPVVIPPREGITYAAGVDVSGGGADEFCWSIAHREGDRPIVDLVAARGSRGRVRLDLDGAVADCAAAMKAYRITTVTGDRYAGDWPLSRFKLHGITFQHAERTKSELFLELLPLVTAGRLELPDDAELLRQAKLLERKRGAQGKDTVDHPVGGHDDRMNAIALGVVEMMRHSTLGPNSGPVGGMTQVSKWNTNAGHPSGRPVMVARGMRGVGMIGGRSRTDGEEDA